jgi:hypothetical protein
MQNTNKDFQIYQCDAQPQTAVFRILQILRVFAH